MMLKCSQVVYKQLKLTREAFRPLFKTGFYLSMNSDSLYNSLFQLLSVPRILKFCLANSIEIIRIDELSCPDFQMCVESIHILEGG